MTDRPARNGLPKSRRLKRQADFARLKEDGRRLPSGCVVLNWEEAPRSAQTPSQDVHALAQPVPGVSDLPNSTRRPEKASGPGRVGIITSRKVGPAVVRNHVRRLLREVYRKHQQELRPNTDIVLIARPSAAGKRFKQVESDFLQAVRRAFLIRPSHPGSGPAPKPPLRNIA